MGSAVSSGLTFPEKFKLVQKKGKLIIKCDEVWSFFGSKGNKQWIGNDINRSRLPDMI
jgi:hypothetical protein